MDRAIRTFLDVLSVQQSASPLTIRAYASDLAQFHAFALGVLKPGGPLAPHAVTPALIREFHL
ncbi:MAG TPA: hypothetical protein DCQ33_13950, partial [Nitrospira sp.]|nr:hypothetical protein [Nitrospira sp.]